MAALAAACLRKARAVCVVRGLASNANASHAANASVTSELPLRTGRAKLVILGSGWAAARLAHDIDVNRFDVVVISPRNHMVFTPLLASTTVGTLEPRSVAVHMHDIQPALSRPGSALLIAEAQGIDTEGRAVRCRSADGAAFAVPYDKLAICTGSQGSTFGIPGVLAHAFFLRDVKQADAIRQRLIENLALAGIPGRSQEEWQRLLHVVIVGGGPTGVEVAGELTDFISGDLRKLYPDRAAAMRVTLVEAKELLGSFDASLREYAARRLIKQGVVLRKGVVREVTAKEVVLTDGTVLSNGLCIWSTGVGPTPFSLSLPFAKTAMGRIAVDRFLRVLAPPQAQAARGEGDKADKAPPSGRAGAAGAGPLADESTTPPTAHLPHVPHVYALGDVCANPDAPLPALAQVAEQQGRYLAKVLNAEARGPAYGETSTRMPPAAFVYRSLGSMATVGGHSAILELANQRGGKRLSLAGFASWVAWRSAYLTRLGSIPKRMAVAFDWSITMLFGRDLSRW